MAEKYSPTQVYSKRRPGPRRVIPTRTATLASLVFLSLVLLAITEIVLAFPLSPGMTVIYAVVCTLLFGPYVLFDRSFIKLAFVLIFYGGVIAIHVTDWNLRKPFWRDLHSIVPGMTLDQVDTIMEEWPLETDPAKAASAMAGSAGMMWVYRPALNGPFSGDFAVIHFREGRVIRVEIVRGDEE